MRVTAPVRALTAAGLVFGVGLGCTTESNYLGYDRLQPLTLDASDRAPTTMTSGDEEPPRPTVSQPTKEPPAPPPAAVDASTEPPAVLDSGTKDSGAADAGAPEAGPMPPAIADAGPARLPNLFVDVLGKTQEEVDDRIAATFEQLFHGDPSSQSIYYEVGEDEAYIYDRFHDDTRMDAAGYGLLITVELDRRTEFDRIWAYTKEHLQFTMGAHAGYFTMKCPVVGEGCNSEAATMGTFFTVTALLFAEARWGNGEGVFDYGAQARDVLDLMMHIEERNEALMTDVVNAFDPETALPRRGPSVALGSEVTPGNVWPAFFEIWGEKTGEPFWATVADTSRAYLNLAAHPETGLFPESTSSDGTVIPGLEVYSDNTYPVSLSLALDQTWYGKDTGQIEIADRAITFFNAFGGGYPGTYLYSGEIQATGPSGALVAMNGSLAGIATIPERDAFIEVVWNTPTPVGVFRYFDGVTQLLSLMYLGGVLRPY